MNSAIAVQAFRYGFLVLLWLFVFVIARVIRSDIFRSDSSSPVLGPPAVGRPARRPASPRALPPLPASRAARPPRMLVVTAGSAAGAQVPLAGPTMTIGRAEDSALVVTDDYASYRHARLTQRQGAWYVEDLGSTNGTYLDQMRVTGPTLVPPGVPIRIGKTAIELRP